MNANGVTNIAGALAGGPQILLGIAHIQSGDYAEGAAKIAEGIGLFIVAYFVGKPTTPTA